MSPKRAETPWRDMTPEEVEASVALGSCSFPVGCFDKRFARGVAGEARTTKKITDKIAAILWKKVVRYRRQIDSAVVHYAKRKMEGESE